MSERPDGFETARVELSAGPVHYRDSGPAHGAETLVFVHGFGVNGRLWDDTASTLAAGHRCIVPDWPMGSHPEPMRPGADLSPPAVARLIGEFLEKLDLDDVTIVGNDSGGAVSQMLVTRHPARIARLVLTNCDCFEKFPPQPFKTTFKVAQLPGVPFVLSRSLQVGFIRRGPLGYGGLTAKPVDDAILRSFVDPLRRDAEVRRDGLRFAAGADPRDTMDAAAKLPDLKIPVLLAWGAADTFFTVADARRLDGLIPDSRLVEIDGAKTFVPLDEPERVASEIASFVADRPLAKATA
jgi:pimeloyl-ACP methyl ester carboxylesterase